MFSFVIGGAGDNPGRVGLPLPSEPVVSSKHVRGIEWRDEVGAHTPPAVQLLLGRSRHLLSGGNGGLDHLHQWSRRGFGTAARAGAESGVAPPGGEQSPATRALAGQFVHGRLVVRWRGDKLVCPHFRSAKSVYGHKSVYLALNRTRVRAIVAFIAGTPPPTCVDSRVCLADSCGCLAACARRRRLSEDQCGGHRHPSACWKAQRRRGASGVRCRMGRGGAQRAQRRSGAAQEKTVVVPWHEGHRETLRPGRRPAILTAPPFQRWS
jgi:hypothetical protein